MTLKTLFQLIDNGRALRIDFLHSDGHAPNIVIATPYFNTGMSLLEAERCARAIMDAVRQGRAINAAPKPFWK